MRMKRKFPQALESAALSLLCAWSAVGCLTTAFHLRVDAEYLMAGVWLAWTLLCTVLMLHRRGTVWLLVIAAVFFGWLWHHGSFGPQLLGTLGVMAKAYDAGYGFGVPEVLQVEPTAADWPLTVLAMFIIFAVSRTVCRRKGNLLPVVLLLGSLGACMVVTDTVPAAQSLFGLLLGVSLLLLTDSVRRENGGQAARLCGTAAIPVALALAVLFSCFPQASFVNTTQTLRENLFSTLMSLPQALQTQGMELLSGLKPREKVELSSLPTQLLLGIPVAEVTAQKTGALYLRVQDYDVYTGTAWESSAGRQDTLAGSGEERGTVQLELLSKQENLLVPAFPDGQVFLREGKAENEDGAGTEYYRLREFSLAAYPGDQWLTLPEHTGMRARALIQAADISTEMWSRRRRMWPPLSGNVPFTTAPGRLWPRRRTISLCGFWNRETAAIACILPLRRRCCCAAQVFRPGMSPATGWMPRRESRCPSPRTMPMPGWSIIITAPGAGIFWRPPRQARRNPRCRNRRPSLLSLLPNRRLQRLRLP